MTSERKIYNENDVLGFESLIEYCLDLPLSFAIWKNQGDYVLISAKMQSLLKFQSLHVSSVDFVRGVSSLFGNFLYEAVEKLSETQLANRKYSTNFSTKYKKNYCITLRYNIRTNIYIFTVIDSNLQQNNSSEDIYTKKISLLNEKIGIFNELLDNVQSYVWQQNKNSKILYCNKEYATALGTTVNDIINSNKHLFKTQSCFSQQKEHIQTESNVKINGENKTMRLTEFVSTTNNDYILGVANEYVNVQDIETKCDGYKNNLSFVSEYVPDGVVLFGSDNRTIIFSENAMSLLELTHADVDGKSFLEVIDVVFTKEIFADCTKDYKKKLLTVIKNADNDVTVKFVPLHSGKTIRVSIIINADRTLLLLIKDVTNTLALEREIKSVRSVYKAVLNNINDGFFIFGSDNRVKFANSAVYGILKQSAPSLDGWHIRDCFNKFEDESIKNFLEDLLKSSEIRVSRSEMVTFSEKTFNCIYIPLPDGLNLLRFKDLSDFKSLEADLRNASEKVAQINELKTNLVTVISDEYVAPLDTVINLAEILNNRYFGDLNEKQTEYCQSIIKTASRLKDVADSVTNIALILTDKANFTFEETNINELIQGVIDSFSRIDPDHLIKFKFTHPSLNVYVDVNFIQKAIYNIVITLISKNEQKHDITIEVYQEPKNDTTFVIDVTDRENCILEKEIALYNGVSLKDFCLSELKTVEIGYVLATLIVGKHNGCLKISSSENNGTSVKIQLQIQRFFF